LGVIVYRFLENSASTFDSNPLAHCCGWRSRGNLIPSSGNLALLAGIEQFSLKAMLARATKVRLWVDSQGVPVFQVHNRLGRLKNLFLVPEGKA
jgi:hypothetical protein